jgi:hypothetical protein
MGAVREAGSEPPVTELRLEVPEVHDPRKWPNELAR